MECNIKGIKWDMNWNVTQREFLWGEYMAAHISFYKSSLVPTGFEPLQTMELLSGSFVSRKQWHTTEGTIATK